MTKSLFVVSWLMLAPTTGFLSQSPLVHHHHHHQQQQQQSSVLENSMVPSRRRCSDNILSCRKVWNDNMKTRTRHRKHRMVRNIDLAEAIVFYGEDSIFRNEGDAKITLLPGVENLLDECQRDEAAVLTILDDRTPDIAKNLLPSFVHVRTATQPPPNPRDVWEAVHSVFIQPKGFGGSSGFGSKAPDPERSPLPKHVVVLCTTIDQCRAARYAGMRVLCLNDNDLADGIVDSDWETITLDDIATPGSFWLNPPHPRDDESYAVDPEQVMVLYEQHPNSIKSTIRSTPGMADEEMMSESELAAILNDIDRL